jgi:hypothetical protein
MLSLLTLAQSDHVKQVSNVLWIFIMFQNIVVWLNSDDLANLDLNEN